MCIRDRHSTFKVDRLKPEAFKIDRPRGVLGMVPGELMTTDEGYATGVDVAEDILKIAVVERHNYTGHIGIGYIKGYGLKSGAVATSISHDSHNIIVVGTNDEDMAAAVNHIAENGGGITVFDGGKCIGDVKLGIAGLMSDAPLIDVNRNLEDAKVRAFELGVSKLIDPFKMCIRDSSRGIATCKEGSKGSSHYSQVRSLHQRMGAIKCFLRAKRSNRSVREVR